MTIFSRLDSILPDLIPILYQAATLFYLPCHCFAKLIKSNTQEHNSVAIFVSATRRRRNIKIPLCLSVPMRKSLIQQVRTWTRAQQQFLRLRLETPFWKKLGPKYHNSQLQLNFGSQRNSNKKNSMVMFIFFSYDREQPCWTNLVQKTKIFGSK